MADQPNSGSKPVTVKSDGDIILVLRRLCFEGFTVLKCYVAYVCSYLATLRDSLSVPFSRFWTASTMNIGQAVPKPRQTTNIRQVTPQKSEFLDYTVAESWNLACCVSVPILQLTTKRQGNENSLQTFLSDQGLIWEYNNKIYHREMLSKGETE
jgi:hypothetical protein